MDSIESRWGMLDKFRKAGRNEWSSACPVCGGRDRFRMWDADGESNARGWCRQCGHFEWLENDEYRPTAEELAQVEKARQRAREENAKVQRGKIASLQRAAYWRGWHDAMGSAERELWYAQGVDDFAIDYYQLGFCADFSYRRGDSIYRSPTLTIPYFRGDNVVNLQHRLLQPVDDGDKYRQVPGLRMPLFLTEPADSLNGLVLVVEGAKKAIITYAATGSRILGHGVQVVGVPSKTPSADNIAELADAERIVIMLDPDANVPDNSGWTASGKLAHKLGRNRCQVVRLPGKPDDMILDAGAGAHELMARLLD